MRKRKVRTTDRRKVPEAAAVKVTRTRRMDAIRIGDSFPVVLKTTNGDEYRTRACLQGWRLDIRRDIETPSVQLIELDLECGVVGQIMHTPHTQRRVRP